MKFFLNFINLLFELHLSIFEACNSFLEIRKVITTAILDLLTSSCRFFKYFVLSLTEFISVDLNLGALYIFNWKPYFCYNFFLIEEFIHFDNLLYVSFQMIKKELNVLCIYLRIKILNFLEYCFFFPEPHIFRVQKRRWA